MNGASQAPLATVFRRRVRVGFEARYEEWLAGIARAAARSPGNQGTTILRPSEEAGEYVAQRKPRTSRHERMLSPPPVRH